MTTLSAWVNGIGLWSPSMPSWDAARARLTAGAVPAGAGADAIAADGKPPPATWLPPNERRRATLGTRLVLSVAQEALTQAGWDAASVPSVFASSSGSPEITDELCAMLAAGDTQISPTKFHNSVHNAAAGYYSIAVACRRASTTIGAFDGSAATGLLEALAQLAAADAEGRVAAEAGAAPRVQTGGALLFVSFDLPYTGPLAQVRDVRDAWGVALALSRAPAASSVARFSLAWHAADANGVRPHGESRCAEPALERARLGNPTARLLPLLQALAAPAPATVVLPAGRARAVLDIASP
jgi:hypothetical protein